jgi:hypothetical protein
MPSVNLRKTGQDAYYRTITDGWMQVTNWGSPTGRIPTLDGMIKRQSWLENERKRFSEYVTEIREKKIHRGRQISMWRRYED